MRRQVMVVVFACCATSCPRGEAPASTPIPDASVALSAQLREVGPRLVSNATSTPLTVHGTGLTKAKVLVFGPPVSRSIPLEVVDDRHAFARFPASVDVGPGSEAVVSVTLDVGGGQTELRLINDTGFPDLVAMAATADGRWLGVVSTTEDCVYALEVASQQVTRVPVADGPSSIAALAFDTRKQLLIVSHWFSPALAIIDLSQTPPSVTQVAAPLMASQVLTGPDGAVFVAEHARDSVIRLDATNAFAERWRSVVAPNPRAMALGRTGLVVGSLQTGELELLDVATGKVLGSAQPGPGMPIVGGTTAKFSAYIMNGKAPRALVASARLQRVFVSSIGPNIGPNPEKMEVSMNGGVGAVALGGGGRKSGLSWQRHLGFGSGVTEALALDDQRGLLYASDVALGLVRVLDAKKLQASDALAARALLQALPLPPPDGFPLIRPAADFGVNGRAGASLHSGPRALVLSADGKSLFVLNRFTGTVARLDVSQAAAGKAVWKGQTRVVEVLGQKTRRLGQVLYSADLGRTAMSCDACHLEGHGEGVLFEKTMPLRIYRSTTVRGSRETPPYFTPASTHSMGETAKVVGTRNRYQNPPMSAEEIEALTLYSSLIPTLPNPFAAASGAPAQSLTLPDGAVGRPLAGQQLFEGKAQCAGCHPAPQFTTDQDVATRGQFLDVGTPRLMPLREQWQNPVFKGFGAPSLVGSWDVFPMLTTGLGGLEVCGDGSVGVASRFPLRVAVERWAPTHGRADLLSPQERDDLLAWVLSL